MGTECSLWVPDSYARIKECVYSKYGDNVLTDKGRRREVTGVTTESILSEISELREFDDYNEANKYLRLGWILLGIRVEDAGDPDVVSQQTIYCLGWPRSLGGVKTPWEKFT